MVEWGERDGSGAAERCVGGAVFEGQGVLFVLCGGATEMATAKVRGSSVSRFRLIRFCFDLFFHGEWDVRSRPRALVRIATRDGSPLAVVHVFF